jgi:hypothetical protein
LQRIFDRTPSRILKYSGARSRKPPPPPDQKTVYILLRRSRLLFCDVFLHKQQEIAHLRVVS